MNEDLVKEENLTNNTNTKEGENKEGVSSETTNDVETEEVETPTNDKPAAEEQSPSEPKEDKSEPEETSADKPLDETSEEKIEQTSEEESGVETEEIEVSEEQKEDTEEVSGEEQETSEPEEAEASDEQEEEIEPDESVFIGADVEMEKALEVYGDAFGPSVGSVVKGEVVKIASDEVMVDIGYKSEGYIDINEFDKRSDGSPDIDVGDKIDVYFMRKEDEDGIIVLSKEIANNKLAWNSIEEAYKEGTPIEGKVTKRIKGGLRVNIGSLQAFLPASQVDIRPVPSPEDYVGETLKMKVIKLSRPRRNIVLSRRLLLEEKLEKKKAKLLDTLEAGQTRKGVVKNITDFGAFVDLGGVDGLLHKTDMSWGRVNHPSEKVSKEDELEVKILDVDVERERVSLGLKQQTPDPWLSIEEKYPEGSTVGGKVVNITDYGAFVELEEGVEGLLHVSEMSWSQKFIHPSKVVNKDDKIEVKVLNIDVEKRRISLGLKQLKPNPWDTIEEKHPPGSKITGKVRNITDFGAFVEVEEGIDGLVHVSDMTWAKRMVNPHDIVDEGEEVEVRVMSIDTEEQRISLSLRHTKPDPWLKVPEKYKVGTTVKGQVVNSTDFGAFAKLEEGVEGLIHISELAEHHVEKVENVVSVGDILNLKVINIDPIERRIGLSLKAYQNEQKGSQEKQDRSEKQGKSRKRRDKDRVPSGKYKEQLEKKPSTALGAKLQEELANALRKKQDNQ